MRGCAFVLALTIVGCADAHTSGPDGAADGAQDATHRDVGITGRIDAASGSDVGARDADEDAEASDASTDAYRPMMDAGSDTSPSADAFQAPDAMTAPDALAVDAAAARDACSPRAWYADRDGDGHGDPAAAILRCDGGAAGEVASSDDCDDLSSAVHPGASEVCNDVDDDCDGTVDGAPAASACRALPNVATVTCDHVCVITSCRAGATDCNGVSSDGCEAPMAYDSSNCGSCGNVCPVGDTCSSGTCRSRPAHRWALVLDGEYGDRIDDLAVDHGTGDVVFVGTTNSTMTHFDGRALPGTSGDLVLGRVSAAGDVRWVLRDGGSASESGGRLALDALGNAFVLVGAAGTATSTTFDGPCSSGSDAMLLRYAPDGTRLWVSRLGGDGQDRAESLVVLADRVLVFGSSYRTAAGPADAIGDKDAIVWTVTLDGAVEHMSRYGSPGARIDFANARELRDGSFAVVGSFEQTVQLGSTTLVSSGTSDVLLTDLAPDGSVRWATRFGTTGEDYGASVVTTADDTIHMGGQRSIGPRFTSFVQDVGPDGTVSSSPVEPCDREVWLYAMAEDRGGLLLGLSTGPETMQCGTEAFPPHDRFGTVIQRLSASGDWTISLGASGGGMNPAALAVDGTGLGYIALTYWSQWSTPLGDVTLPPADQWGAGVLWGVAL